MSCLGVHLAITSGEAAELLAMDDEDERLEHLQEVLEETYFEKFADLVAESDKAWDEPPRLSWRPFGLSQAIVSA